MVAFTPSLTILDPNKNNRWNLSHTSARLHLTDKDIGPDTMVYIAEVSPANGGIMAGGKEQLPAVCEAFGAVAARRIAEGSHRIATPEEVQRFGEERKTREGVCSEMERNNPQNRKNTERIVERTVVMSQSEAERAGYMTAASPDNKPTGANSAAAVLKSKAEERGR